MKTKRYLNNKKKHYFALGGGTDLSNIALGSGGAGGTVGMQGTEGIVNTLSGVQKLTSLIGLGSGGIGGMLGGGMGGVANGIATGLNNLMNPNGNETGIGNALSAVGSLASNIPGVGGIIGAGVNLVGGLVNSAFGSNINEEFVKDTENKAQQQAHYDFSASDNSGLLANYANYRNQRNVTKDEVGSEGWFSNAATNKTKELNALIDEANRDARASFTNTALNLDEANDRRAASNYFDEGGGIHIKKKNRGKFTSYCGGKVTSECIARGKRSSSPTIRKRATFAANARKWKHEDGGPLFTHGGIWDNGLTYINEGGSHEENPFEGVQMGVDPQGIPNLVEEGEVVYNDYVFSNRMKVPKDVKKKLKTKGDTFAEAAKELSKESEERPNDPISKNGLDAFMSALSESQEELRMKNENKRANRYAKGGKLGKLFEGLGPDSNWIDYGTLATPITSDQLERMMELGVDGSDIPLIGTSEDIDNAITRAAAEKGVTTGGKFNLSYLRYAPAIMSGISAFSDIFSKPDYSAADRVAGVEVNPALVKYSPVGQYLTYRPLDRNYYTNQLRSNAAANRRAIINTSGGNRAAALAGILAADANYGENLGKLARQAEEYNQALKERVVGFNRQTDMFNSQQSMQAQTANQASRNSATQMRLAQAERVAQLRQAAKDAYNARRSNNLNSFITNLGNIGWEDYQREMINSNPALYYTLSGIGGVGYKGTKKNGGKLKKKRRTTYA